MIADCQAFALYSVRSFPCQSFAASKNQFLSSACCVAPLRYRSRSGTHRNGMFSEPPSASRHAVQSSMAGSESVPSVPEEEIYDLNTPIVLTEEEKALCGDFRADLPLLNKAVLSGRLGADPILRAVGADSKVCKFSLAVSTEYDPDEGPDQDRTSWFDIEAWGSTAEYISRYGKKGMRVGVSGSIHINAWTGKDGQERETSIVTADTFEILQSRSEQMPSMGNTSNYANEGANPTGYTRQDTGMGTAQDLTGLPF